MSERTEKLTTNTVLILFGLALGVCIIYLWSNPKPNAFYDYTYRIAGALLQGKVGLEEQPPAWLNEMVPRNGKYYSVFPLGSVISMLPVAMLNKLGVIQEFPARWIAALLAGGITFFSFLIAQKFCQTRQQQILYALFPALGSWMWANLSFAGAWQIALGFAVLGQLGALYHVLVKPHAFLAGCYFALAFGNRTEILLLAPIFICLLCRDDSTNWGRFLTRWRKISLFLIVPFTLGVLTLIYNYLRFDSITDFGYAHIPGVLEEPWYQHGIFSWHAIPLNVKAMLFEPWKLVDYYPYLVPTGFGGSIFLSSPLLFLIFRRETRDLSLAFVSWSALAIVTLTLWLHGNPGGWQFSYRYAMVLLPWLLLILLHNRSKGNSIQEVVVLILSIGINAYGTYLFLWTDYVRP